MSNKSTYQGILFLLIVWGCQPNEQSKNKAEEEIVKTEKAFAEMALDQGIAEAFLNYADQNAVLMRDNQLIIGKDAIRARLQKPRDTSSKASLQWSPDFVEASTSGDLGYTYGQYTYTVTDSLGQKQERQGVFHTVWKKQPDGSWKFVWD